MAKKKIDFSGVETFERAAEGAHVAKIVSVDETSFSSGNEGFKVVFEITKGVSKGARVYENYPLIDTALWKLKALLEAIKIKCDGRIMLDTEKMVGKICEIEVSHEEYNGTTRARLAAVNKLGASKIEEDEDEEPDEDLDEELEEDEEEEPAKKSPKKTEKKQLAKKSKKSEPVEDEEEEDEDEEEEKPVKKAKAEKKPTKKAEKKPAKKTEPEEDDDDDWDDDWDDEE